MKHTVFDMDLQLFADPNTQTTAGLSEEMRVFYSDYLIDNAVPQRPGIRDQRIEAYCGEERDLTYSIGIYTVNHYLFSPIKAGKEI